MTLASSQTPERSDLLRAGLWMTGTITAFTAMAIAAREGSVELDTFELMTYRSLIGFAVVVVLAGATGTFRQIRRNFFKLHLLRNLAHFTGQNLWFFALAAIPLAQVFAFEFTMPIWITLLAHFFLGERLSRVRILSVLVGFAGILMVTRPWSTGVSVGVMAAFLSAIFFAATGITTKALTRHESITSIMFWLTGTQLILGIVCSGLDGDVTLPSRAMVPWIAILGIGGLVAHFCLTKALSAAPASVVAPIDFARLPIIAFVGMILYNEAVSIWVFFGAVVIFGANYANILSEKRSNQRASSQNPPEPKAQ